MFVLVTRYGLIVTFLRGYDERDQLVRVMIKDGQVRRGMFSHRGEYVHIRPRHE